jgi:hypothetical protein
MKYNFRIKALALLSAALLTFASCEKEDDAPRVDINNLKGMFVACEGSFSASNGDVSWFHPDSTTSITKLFNTANDYPVGSIVQSFAIVDTLGFLVVNNSQKVTVVNMRNFKFIKSIGGFSYPRNIIKADNNHVLISNGNGYDKCWVYSIDIATLSKADSVEVGRGPEKMIKMDNNIYVTNSGGFTNDDSTVMVINLSTLDVTDTIFVNKVPVDLVSDKNKNIWVYCKGVPDYSTWPNTTYANSGLVKVNLSNKTQTSLEFPKITCQSINNLAIDNAGENLFYITDALYKMSITASQLPTTPFFDNDFYGVDVDPQSGNIVGLDEINSKAVVIDANGNKLYSFDTNSYPNSVTFQW